jgi:hypothetical protein
MWALREKKREKNKIMTNMISGMNVLNFAFLNYFKKKKKNLASLNFLFCYIIYAQVGTEEA